MHGNRERGNEGGVRFRWPQCQTLYLDVGVVLRRLGTVSAILRATPSLNGEQRALLHLPAIMVLTVNRCLFQRKYIGNSEKIHRKLERKKKFFIKKKQLNPDATRGET